MYGINILTLILLITAYMQKCIGLETNSQLHTMRLLYMERELLSLSRDILRDDEHFSHSVAENDKLEDIHDFRTVQK